MPVPLIPALLFRLFPHLAQSVKDLVAVNKQMLMILDKLGLTTEKTIRDDDDDKQ